MPLSPAFRRRWPWLAAVAIVVAALAWWLWPKVPAEAPAEANISVAPGDAPKAAPVQKGTRHKDNYVAWQQMRPRFESSLAELGAQIRVALDKGR